jgi:hypothetical protein
MQAGVGLNAKYIGGMRAMYIGRERVRAFARLLSQIRRPWRRNSASRIALEFGKAKLCICLYSFCVAKTVAFGNRRHPCRHPCARFIIGSKVAHARTRSRPADAILTPIALCIKSKYPPPATHWGGGARVCSADVLW